MDPSRITDTAIWENYYRVRMNYLHSRPMEHLKKYGTRISGIEEIDKQLDRQMIETEMTIDMMFEKWRSGVTIHVVNYDDTAEIYKIIQAHLVTWAEYLTHGVNVGDAPLKDLMELDKFAAVVYDKAVSVFSAEEQNMALAHNFMNVQSINFFNVLKRRHTDISTKVSDTGVEVVRIEKEDKKLPERNSMKDIFNAEINRNAIWRNR